MGMRRRSLTNKTTAPDYAGLTDVDFHHRAEGLVVNTTNAAGVVDGSGNVTKISSMSPHASGVEFDSNGTAPVLSGGSIVFAGTGTLRHNGAGSVFNAYHYNSNINLVTWCVHFVVKIGSGSNPGAEYGVFGNNGSGSGNKGISGRFSDASAANRNNAFVIQITRGTSQSFILQAENNNIIEPNRLIDVWIEIDKSLTTEDQAKLYINGYKTAVSMRVDSATAVTTPSFSMEIGGCGNGSAMAVMELKEITFQRGLPTSAFRQKFILARMYKYGIVAYPHTIEAIQRRSFINLFNIVAQSRYFLTVHLCQNPSNPNVIVSLFSDMITHVYDADRLISMRVSQDKGRTWSTKSTVFNPVGAEAAGTFSAGYGSGNRLHLIADTHTDFAVSATHKLYYMYSDDDGATFSTPVDITSVIPSDGLNTWRTYVSLIENDSVLLSGFYKQTDEGDVTNSARYLLRSTDNGATWAAVLVQSSSIYRNEMDLVALSSSFILLVTRDEVTHEWYQSVSTDNGATWTNQGALDFGEALTRESPVRLVTFLMDGTLVVACYYADRDRDQFKVVYAKASDIIASGIAGWVLATKFVIFQGGNSQHLHYGDVCHYNNDFNAIAMYAYDQFPGVGTGEINQMYTFDVPTCHYEFVKTQLGI